MLTLHLLMITVATCNEEAFLEQPGPGPTVLAPIGTQVQLSCSVREGYRIEWGITLPNGDAQLFTSQPEVLEILLARGIAIESTSNEMSLLVINATQSTNGTTAKCIAIERNNLLLRQLSRQVQVLHFGPPSIPTNFMTVKNGVGSLRISWSSSFSTEGVTVEFTLTATNLNTSSTTIVRGIQEQHYIFTVEDYSSCDVYTFQVTTLNDAGSSDPSEILTRSLPSLPDISAVEDSLEQSLVKTANGITLSVMFQGITSCPEYPVTRYTLVLVDSEGNETRESSAVTSGEITLVVDGLMEDSFYSYCIVATNMIGNSASTVLNKTTTDVQEISICLVEGITYSIQCSYITGSDARGCVYTLVSGVEGVANITGTIDRSSSEGVQIDLPNVGDFLELIVYDWKRDNTTSTLPLKVAAHLLNPGACLLLTASLLIEATTLITTTTISTSNTNMEPSLQQSSRLPFFMITAGSASAAVLLLLAIVLTFFTLTCYRIRKKRQVRSALYDDHNYDYIDNIKCHEVMKSTFTEQYLGVSNFNENPSYSIVENRANSATVAAENQDVNIMEESIVRESTMTRAGNITA